jgi:dihydrofolate reductase
MRKLIVTNIVSLDGCYERPGHNVMVLPMDHSFDTYNAERLRTADTLLLGRNTYDLFKGFWPQIADNSDATPIHAEISRLEDAIDKVVVSDSITAEQTEPWRDTTRILRRANAHEDIADLRARSGSDILVFGSRTLWNDSPRATSAGALIQPKLCARGTSACSPTSPAWSRGRPPSPRTSTRWSVSFSAGVEKLRRLNESS